MLQMVLLGMAYSLCVELAEDARDARSDLELNDCLVVFANELDT